jgi:Spy/CpxP family protein refolding chaperone
MGQGMGRGFGGAMDNPGTRGRLMQRGMAQLNLTQAQQDQMKAFRELQQKDMQAVRERMKGARQRLQEAMKADIPDEAAVKAAAGVMATVQSEQFVLHARAKAQMMKVLTPEQQTQLKQRRARMNQIARRQMRLGMMGRGMMRQGMMGQGMRRNQMGPWRAPMMGPVQPMQPGMARRWRGWI